jgi:hypothetical protein
MVFLSPQSMNTTSTRSQVRRSTIAALLAGVALSLCACSTTSALRNPNEKSVSYKELHGMMERLVQEPSQASAERQTAGMAPSIGNMGSSSTLATNP